MVFCPSYAYLRLIQNRLEEFIRDTEFELDILAQHAEMTLEDRDAFIRTFEPNRNRNLVGLVVSGGVFGEGIDLVHDSLIGAIIVGVGLPGISPENDAIADYYHEQHQYGYEFAYQFPGINQVLQNAGRVVRTATDKGIICLVDNRYLNYNYSVHFPPHWDIQYVNSQRQLGDYAKLFWNKFEA